MYLTPTHVAKGKLLVLIANLQAALSHVRAFAEQFSLTDRWNAFLDEVVVKITRPLTSGLSSAQLSAAGYLQDLGLLPGTADLKKLLPYVVPFLARLTTSRSVLRF